MSRLYGLRSTALDTRAEKVEIQQAGEAEYGHSG